MSVNTLEGDTLSIPRSEKTLARVEMETRTSRSTSSNSELVCALNNRVPSHH